MSASLLDGLALGFDFILVHKQRALRGLLLTEHVELSDVVIMCGDKYEPNAKNMFVCLELTSSMRTGAEKSKHLGFQSLPSKVHPMFNQPELIIGGSFPW